MRNVAGLWIDHEKAIVVSLTDTDENVKRVIANIEKTHSESADSMPDDDIRQRVLTGHLNTYYDEVISSVKEAESVFIFGPGEAKGELKKRFERARLEERIVGVEPADQMTEPQIVAKVRDRFIYRMAADIG